MRTNSIMRMCINFGSLEEKENSGSILRENEMRLKIKHMCEENNSYNRGKEQQQSIGDTL